MASFTRVGSKWQARIRKKGFPSTSENFDTKKEAETWAAKIETEMNEKLYKDKRALKNLTLGILVGLYFKKEQDDAPYGATKRANLNRINRMLGDVLLPALTFDRLVTFVKDRKAQGAGGVTIGMDIAEIATVLRSWHEEKDKDFDSKVFTKVRAYMTKNGLDPKSEHRDRRPTEEELTAIKKHFDAKPRQKIPMSTLIDFAVASAMRASEIARIAWKDVDFVKKTVIIRKRKHPTRPRDQVVPLLGKAWEILMAQPQTEKRIFPYNHRTFSTIFPRAVKACGIEDLHFHDLRHEAASKLFERGYDIPRVAMVTGHMDWKMLARYTQLRPEDLHPDEDGNLLWQQPQKKSEHLTKALFVA